MLATDSNLPTQANLILPLDSIMDRSENDQSAQFSFVDNDGYTHFWEVKVSTRGKFRQSRCDVPPIKIDFKKKDLRKAGLAEFDKYKLVLPCFGNPQGEELVMKEYLAYQAYQIITPNSFRTQLLHLTLVDENGGMEQVVTAFIIEANKEMATRIGGVEVEDGYGADADVYDAESEVTHALFQYLVGNGDWSLLLRKNVKIVKVGERQIPVGYDFDFTGWVGAPYATANSNIGQKSIYERIYLGYAQPDLVIDDVVLHFAKERRNVLKLIRESSLSYDALTATERFAARFFTRLNRLKSDREMTLYDQLRGETAMYIPMGEPVDSFRSMGR